MLFLFIFSYKYHCPTPGSRCNLSFWEDVIKHSFIHSFTHSFIHSYEQLYRLIHIARFHNQTPYRVIVSLFLATTNMILAVWAKCPWIPSNHVSQTNSIPGPCFPIPSYN